MNNYTDHWGRYHDKPVTIYNPIPSNNGWIYTAYAQKLDLYINRSTLQMCFDECEKLTYWNRHPGTNRVPMSRDEILGMVHLGYITAGDLIFNDWKFNPYPIPKFNILKTIASALRLRKAHRNALWQNEGEPHMFRFAFSVPLQDRAWILHRSGIKAPLVYKIAEFISRKIKSDNMSSNLIEWLKYGNNPNLTLFEAYFGKEHIFCRQIRGD